MSPSLSTMVRNMFASAPRCHAGDKLPNASIKTRQTWFQSFAFSGVSFALPLPLTNLWISLSISFLSVASSFFGASHPTLTGMPIVCRASAMLCTLPSCSLSRCAFRVIGLVTLPYTSTIFPASVRSTVSAPSDFLNFSPLVPPRIEGPSSNFPSMDAFCLSSRNSSLSCRSSSVCATYSWPESRSLRVILANSVPASRSFSSSSRWHSACICSIFRWHS